MFVARGGGGTCSCLCVTPAAPFHVPCAAPHATRHATRNTQGLGQQSADDAVRRRVWRVHEFGVPVRGGRGGGSCRWCGTREPCCAGMRAVLCMCSLLMAAVVADTPAPAALLYPRCAAPRAPRHACHTTHRYMGDNQLATLPDGVFDGQTSLLTLCVGGCRGTWRQGRAVAASVMYCAVLCTCVVLTVVFAADTCTRSPSSFPTTRNATHATHNSQLAGTCTSTNSRRCPTARLTGSPL